VPKILLVEDNEWNRDMLARRLARCGFEVVIATDGQQGVEEALRQPVDLVLMDLSLPVMDGWDALKQLKADPQTQPIPVIALTAHALMSDRERALQAGFDDYDSKPVEFSRLIGKINNLLNLEVGNVQR
jgi:two-component system, cell cycle response regulator DivK